MLDTAMQFALTSLMVCEMHCLLCDTGHGMWCALVSGVTKCDASEALNVLVCGSAFFLHFSHDHEESVSRLTIGFAGDAQRIWRKVGPEKSPNLDQQFPNPATNLSWLNICCFILLPILDRQLGPFSLLKLWYNNKIEHQLSSKGDFYSCPRIEVKDKFSNKLLDLLGVILET